MSEIHININGQDKYWPQPSITPKDILEVGEKQEPYSNYVIFKIQHGSKEKVWNGAEQDIHKNIKIENGDKFDIVNNLQGVKIHYTVNGEAQEISSTNDKQTVAQILERAKFVPVEKFKLFNAKTKKTILIQINK